MFIKITVIYLVQIFLLFTIIFRGADGCFILSKVHVTFNSHLPANNHKPLVVHCWSSEDNLGSHILMSGQSWGFSFCQKPFKTKFICELHWNGFYINHLVAFNTMWFKDMCDKECMWKVTEQGATLQHGKFHFWDNYPPMSNSIPPI
ncbi:hypothetical protein CASFOL_000843 [Castilleja foliolosa]|uniref:S-protein homolog n=1 Tax=Castilleja foliolosa TaxID=1961234 RepID=A0ABD3EMT6_9LAMI